MKKQCAKCGFELLENEEFCPQCGYFERRKPFYLTMFILSIVALIILLLALFGVFDKSISYTFTPEFSNKFFGMSTQEFCEVKGEGTILYDTFKSSYVDDKCNLIVEFTETQNELVRDHCFSKIRSLKEELTYSPDYTQISAYVFQETCNFKTATLYYNLGYFALAQIFNGVDFENIKLNYKVIDAGTYEELLGYNWNSLEGYIGKNEDFKFDVASISSEFDEQHNR